LAPISSADAQSAGPSFLDAATIEAGTSDTKVNIGISGFMPKSGSGDWYHQFGLGGEAAVTKGSTDDVTVGTLSGLSKGSSARASFSFIHWKRLTQEEADTQLAFCRTHFTGLIGDYTWDEAPLSLANAGCDRGLFTAERLMKIAEGLEARRKECAEGKSKLKPEQCALIIARGEAKVVPATVLIEKLPVIVSAWAEQMLPRAPAHFINLGTKVNRAKANYFAEIDFTQLQKEHTTGYGGSASYSYFRRPYLLTGGFSIEKSYKNNDEVEVCTPLPDTTALRCITGSIGPPTRTWARIGFAEARWLVGNGRVGIAPRAEYDFTGSTYAVRVPIYLAPDKKKSLIGGIALGYTDKDDEGFGVSVFVGKAFSFFD
jgi:hypothetical protein